MPKKIDWQIIRIDFVQGDMTYSVLAQQHGVSRQAIERRGSQENWQLLRQSYRREKSLTENQEKDDGLNLDGLLKKAIALAFAQLETAPPPKSFEAAARSLIGVTEVYFKLKPPRPPTVAEWMARADEFGLAPAELIEEIKKQVDS